MSKEIALLGQSAKLYASLRFFISRVNTSCITRGSIRAAWAYLSRCAWERAEDVQRSLLSVTVQPDLVPSEQRSSSPWGQRELHLTLSSATCPLTCASHITFQSPNFSSVKWRKEFLSHREYCENWRENTREALHPPCPQCLVSILPWLLHSRVPSSAKPFLMPTPFLYFFGSG